MSNWYYVCFWNLVTLLASDKKKRNDQKEKIQKSNSDLHEMNAVLREMNSELCEINLIL